MTTETPEIPTTTRMSEELLRHSVPAQSWYLATSQPMLRIGGMSPYRPSRREFLIGAGSLLVLAPYGCGAESGEGGTDSDEMLTFRHFAGATEVPQNPQRIVALQDQNALLPLLELGVTPVGSAGDPNESRPGGSFRRVADYDTSEVEYVGDYLEPNLELVASQEPDLVVGTESNEGIYDRLSEIAPTVLVQVFDRPLTEVLDDFARLVGRQERHDELEASYRKAVDDLVAGLPGAPEEITLSYIEFSGDGTFYAPSGQAVGTVLEDVGFARPEAQPKDASAPYGESLSFEDITAHDADVMITADYSGGIEGGGDQAIKDARQQPLFQELGVVQRDEFHVFDGLAMVGSAFGKMENFVEFLSPILVERDPKLDGG